MRACIALVILTIALPAQADFETSRRIDTTDVRAMGGVSGVSGTPAAAAASDINLSIFGLVIDMRGSLSQGIAAYGWANDAMDFKDNIGSLTDPINLLAQRDKLAALSARIPPAFDFQSRIDFARIQIGNRRVGQFLFGVYAEGFAGIRMSLPKPGKVDIANMAIDLGQPTTLLMAAGKGDTGGRVGYGRLFGLTKEISLAAGIQARVFHRWLVRPYNIGLDAQISGEDNFHVPDFSYETAVGGAVDLSSILLVDNRYLSGRGGIEINGLGAINYAGGVERETMDFAISAVVQPLRYLNFRRWEVGNEIHAFEDGRVSYHVGTSITWGGHWLNFSPRIGGILGERMVFGETRNAFSVGFSTTLGIFCLAGVVELYQGGYDAGIRLAIGG